jgi:hypothetical protein
MMLRSEMVKSRCVQCVGGFSVRHGRRMMNDGLLICRPVVSSGACHVRCGFGAIVNSLEVLGQRKMLSCWLMMMEIFVFVVFCEAKFRHEGAEFLQLLTRRAHLHLSDVGTPCGDSGARRGCTTRGLGRLSKSVVDMACVLLHVVRESSDVLEGLLVVPCLEQAHGGFQMVMHCSMSGVSLGGGGDARLFHVRCGGSAGLSLGNMALELGGAFGTRDCTRLVWNSGGFGRFLARPLSPLGTRIQPACRRDAQAGAVFLGGM